MNIEYVGRNCQVDDDVRRYAEDKLRKLEKFVVEPVAVRVTLELERHRHLADLHVAHRHGVLQATEETATDWRDALNATVDKLEKQARRDHRRHLGRRRRTITPDAPAQPAPTNPTSG